MGHQIHPAIKEYYFASACTQSKEYFMGLKFFDILEDGIYEPYTKTKYEMRYERGGLIKLTAPIQEQSVEINVPMYLIKEITTVPQHVRLNLGTPIYPLINSKKYSNACLVLFDWFDLIFYDGVNVSVRSFYLTDPTDKFPRHGLINKPIYKTWEKNTLYAYDKAFHFFTK